MPIETQAPSAGDSASPTKARESLSQLVARILDQLSISAWLPAGALVFILLLEGNIPRDHVKGKMQLTSMDRVAYAIKAIGNLNFRALILLVASVVLLTMITQAFEFEAIQLLEGYWGPSRPLSVFAGIRSRRHLRKRRRLEEGMEEVSDAAFAYAITRMQRDEISPSIINILLAKRLGKQGAELPASEEDRRAADQMNWEEYANVSHLRRLEQLDGRLKHYPADHRVLPTRLGNTLRAYEDLVDDAEGRLQGMVLRLFDQLPTALQSELDQYRSRLDLYCSLLLVLIIGGATGVYLLPGNGLKGTAVVLALFLAWLSYRAAIVSARGYGIALLEVNDFKPQLKLPATGASTGRLHS